MSSSLPVPAHLELPLVALHLMRAKGDLPQAAYFAEHAPLGSRSDRVTTILRAAVSAGGAQLGNWGEPLAALATASRTFIETLRPVSFAALLASIWRPVPLAKRVTANSAVVVAGVTGEGTAKRASALTLADGAIEPNKVVIFITITDEVLRSGEAAAVAFLGAELRIAVAAGLDAAVLDLLAIGAVPIVATGITPTAVLAALHAALVQVSRGAASRLVGAVGPATAAGLATLADSSGILTFPELDHRGGTMAGIQVVAVDGVEEGRLWIADGGRIGGSLGPIMLDSSRQAALRLTDDGLDPTADDIVRSLFAEGLVALRGECQWGAEVLSPDAAVVIDGLTFPAA